MNFKFKILNCVFALCLLLVLSFPQVSFAAFNDSAIWGRAWSPQMGWIHFETSHGDARITDNGLRGHAWNDNFGWINLNPVNGATRVDVDGNLAGHAWNNNVGWINLSGVSVGGDGTFSGTAYGDNGVVFLFSGCAQCKVTSEYRPIRLLARSPLPPEKTQEDDSVEERVAPATLSIDITYVKSTYFKDEPVIIKGFTNPGNTVFFYLDNTVGSLLSKSDGAWTVDFGQKSPGDYVIEVAATNSSGDVSPHKKASFTVVDQETPLGEKIIQKIKDLFLPQPSPDVVKVPLKTPFAFTLKEKILDFDPIKEFIFAPLPRRVASILEKFPKLEKVFEQTGITRFNQLPRLKETKLSFPNLGEAFGQRVPLARLDSFARLSIPSEVLFVKDGSGLIDMNVTLSLLAQKGEVQQRIDVVSGKPIQFIVKADHPARSVTGYIVFKSRNLNDAAVNINREDVSLSAFLPNPFFSAAISASQIAQLEKRAKEAEMARLSDLSHDESFQEEMMLAKFDYKDTGQGVYAATVYAPIPQGQYEVITIVDYQEQAHAAKEIRMILVVDPEGYIYTKTGNLETRIARATVTLMVLNPKIQTYELWQARDFLQENPQITGPSGSYSFLTPEGVYYLKVEAPGFLVYESKPFVVREGGAVHMNIAMRPKYWMIKELWDWKGLAIIVIAIFLLYNLYKGWVKRRKNLIPG